MPPTANIPTDPWSDSVPGPRTTGDTDPYAAASAAAGVAAFAGSSSVVAPVAAILLGRKARERMAADPSLRGMDLVRAGETLAWAKIGLAVIGLIFALIMFVSIMSDANQGNGFGPSPSFPTPSTLEPVFPTGN